MVIIVVIAILATVVTIAYRETQKNARNEKRKADAVMLRGSLDEYYADNGSYPKIVYENNCVSSNDEVWQFLKEEGYLKSVPNPETKSPYLTRYKYRADCSTADSFIITVPMENIAGYCEIPSSSSITITEPCNF